uniref:Transmembrane protein n=1 Tax=Medicago truncatula TaxID=3880 RepID=I3SGC7_MEDTR|nr:unknown [Medicago truncatula]
MGLWFQSHNTHFTLQQLLFLVVLLFHTTLKRQQIGVLILMNFEDQLERLAIKDYMLKQW